MALPDELTAAIDPLSAIHGGEGRGEVALRFMERSPVGDFMIAPPGSGFIQGLAWHDV